MLFNSYVFLGAFLPLVLVLWWGFDGKNVRLALLTAASWVFYSWWDWRFLPLMLVSTTVDFVAARLLSGSDDERFRRLVLTVSLATNLGLLGFFKYATFFFGSLKGLGTALDLPVDVPALQILLPIGISFYTFNSMSYTIDVFRRRLRPTTNLLEYSAFVALFPHLVAGPIVRYADVGRQLRRPLPRLHSGMASLGLFFLSVGLVKKLLVADQLDPHVDLLFSSSVDPGLLASWAAAVGYSLQLYFDFSGYSDMAVGLAWLLGIRFPQNFDSPFKAQNISDFWRRWHISLSTWFRDYLFIPLGGSRAGTGRTTFNLLGTMALVGLWHGAAWTFVVWGIVHGAYLSTHALLRKAGLTPRNVAVNRLLTFVLVVAAFVIFRAEDLGSAGRMLMAMMGLRGLDPGSDITALLPIGFVAPTLLLLAFVHLAPDTWDIDLAPRRRYGLALGCAAALAVMTIAQPHPFIYFQF